MSLIGVLSVCVGVVSGVFKFWCSWLPWLLWKGRKPIVNKIVVRRISEIPLCANHTGLWRYLPVCRHTTKGCALKQNLYWSRFCVVSGSGAVGGYLCGPTPVAFIGAFAGGAAGGFLFDCTVTVVLTHCKDNEIVLYGHFESLHVFFREDATQNEYVRETLCLFFRIIMDGFAGILGYNAIEQIYTQLKPTAPKIDLKALQASKTKKYKDLEVLMKHATREEKLGIAKQIVLLRQEVFDLIGDGDKGHKEYIDNLMTFIMKNPDFGERS